MENKDSTYMCEVKQYAKKSPFRKIRLRQRIILLILMGLALFPCIYAIINIYILK